MAIFRNSPGLQSKNLHYKELSTDSLRNPVPSKGENRRNSFKNPVDCGKANYPLKNKYRKKKCNVKD